jgi:hypothetical protein
MQLATAQVTGGAGVLDDGDVQFTRTDGGDELGGGPGTAGDRCGHRCDTVAEARHEMVDDAGRGRLDDAQLRTTGALGDPGGGGGERSGVPHENPGLGEQGAGGGSGRHPGGAPVEQPGPRDLLQAADRLRHRGLGHPEALGGGGHAPFLDDGQEVLPVGQQVGARAHGGPS